MARLVVRKESGKIESESVKMESRGNKESKLCEAQKKWDGERKFVGPGIYLNDQNTPHFPYFPIPYHFQCATKRTLNAVVEK